MLRLSSQRSRISTPANHAAGTLGSRLMKTSKSGGKHFLIIGISLVTGIVLLVNGWILSAGSVFENRAFSELYQETNESGKAPSSSRSSLRVRKIWLCPRVQVHKETKH